MKIGLIGLGNMGLNLLLNLTEKGHEVIAWNRSADKRIAAREKLAQLGDNSSDVVEELAHLLEKLEDADLEDNRKVIISIISAGDPIDQLFFGEGDSLIGKLGKLNKGGIVLDLANSHYQDSARRAAKFAEEGIEMLDIGISGGMTGARNGACMMVGGERGAYEHVKPVLESACQPGGLGYVGKSGAGHFVKMVHNGIEYGMMQSIAEGMNLINSKQEYNVDLAQLLSVWGNGSIIEGKLIGFLQEAYEADAGLTGDSEIVGDNGTGKWVVQEALDQGVPLPAISAGLFARYRSRRENNYLGKVISAMRRVFGGHSGGDRS